MLGHIYIHIMQKVLKPFAKDDICTPDTYKASPEEREEAQRALTKYDMLTDHGDRMRFLKNFEENGGGTGKDSMKFVSKFQKIFSCGGLFCCGLDLGTQWLSFI